MAAVSGPVSALTLSPRPPFSLERTVRALQRLPDNVVDRWSDGSYVRALRLAEGERLVSVAQEGTVRHPRLRVAVLGGTVSSLSVREMEATLDRVLGLQVNLQPFAQRARALPQLDGAVERLEGLHPPRFVSLFEALANAIPFQQVSLQAGAAMVRRLVLALGGSVAAEGASAWLFPDAAVVADASHSLVRACGLSGRKTEALRGAARAIAQGSLAEGELLRLPSDEAVARLRELPGVGRWTAELVLLRGLGRLDVFPSGDAGARRTLGRLLGKGAPLTEAEEGALLERFGSWRGLLYFYGLGWRQAERELTNREGR